MTQAQEFFFQNAGFSYVPAPKGPYHAKRKRRAEENGRRRCAEALADAEAYAEEHGLEYEWEFDQDGCIGCDCGSDECSCSTGEPHEVLCCLLRDPETREVLASLGGVCEPSREYWRVIEAELALEGMSLHNPASDEEELSLA